MAHPAGLLSIRRPATPTSGSPGPFPADKDVLGSGVADSVPSELNLAKRTILFKHVAAGFFCCCCFLFTENCCRLPHLLRCSIP